MSVVSLQLSEPPKCSKPDVLLHEMIVARLKAGPTSNSRLPYWLVWSQSSRPTSKGRVYNELVLWPCVTSASSCSGSQALTGELTCEGWSSDVVNMSEKRLPRGVCIAISTWARDLCPCVWCGTQKWQARMHMRDTLVGGGRRSKADGFSSILNVSILSNASSRNV